MSEFHVFRWAQHLVVGVVALLITAAVAIPWDVIQPGIQAVTDISSVVAIATVLLIPAYVVGSVLRDVGFLFQDYFLAPFLDSLPRRDCIYRYRQASVRKTLDGLGANTALGCEKDLDRFRHRFRFELARAMEKLDSVVGPRITGQWEHLGMLEALMLLWVSYLVILPALWGAGVTGILAGSGIIPQLVSHWRAEAIVFLLFVLTGLAYRYRTDVFAREVAIASILLGDSELDQ